MGRSTVHYADNKINNALNALHNKLRPAGTPVQRVEYIIELLLLRIFETKIKQDDEFKPLRDLFSSGYKWLNPKTSKEETNENRLFSYLPSVFNEQIVVLKKIKDVFASNITSKQEFGVSDIFGNPIYERLIGSYKTVDEIFGGKFENVLKDLNHTFRLLKSA